MIHTIENDELIVQVDQKGMELQSVRSKKTGTEYIWQGDPAFWSSRAPVLFPVIGSLKDGTTFIEGVSYKLPKHGLIRNSDQIKLHDKTERSVSFSFDCSADTLPKYPYRYLFRLKFSLMENSLQVEHTITNIDNKTMYYCLGGHPAFRCPLNSESKYEDHFLRLNTLEKPDSKLLNSDGLLTEQTQQVFTEPGIIPLHHDLFIKDALVFDNISSKSVELVHNKLGPVLSVHFADFCQLGIWAKHRADFVCIEPWLGTADPANSDQIFENKKGVQKLEPDKIDNKKYSIRFYH